MITVGLLVALALPASSRAQEVVQLDPATDTVRMAARLDGTLTRPASGTAAAIGLRYVREHRAALGLSAADLETLGDAQVETFAGIRQVRWRQQVDGIETADTELRVSVTDDGRVLSVLGSPSSDLPADTTPRLGKPDPDAALTIYDDRLAYRYEDAVAADEIYDVITDADTGAVLKRTNLVKSATGRVWEHYPGAPSGGAAVDTVFPATWMTPADRLESPWVHAYVDSADDNTANPADEVAPRSVAFVPFADGVGCETAKPCAWNGTSGSKATNRDQNAIQAYYLANRFRDHLAAAPIGFDEFDGVDRIRLETSDGSGTNNANMYTPPEGKAPRMQMFFWSDAGRGFRSVNSGDDAAILYHEYTHGLTNRLVKTPDGVGALSSWQAGAMGEGWSDFYAKDFIVTQELETDTATPGQIHMGAYTDVTKNRIRSSALDCPANSGGDCPGYTYGDFAKIVAGGPEVHYDGEIWAQTLWDLRTSIGSADALRLVTAALRLSPPEPSFLDMRNAILVAAAADPAALRAKIWKAFADRGMGFYAGATDGADIAPVENFQTPPDAATPRGTITGRIVDAGGAGVPGITVGIGGLDAGPDKRTAVTGADGTYTIADVPVGTYANVVASAPGYDRALIKNVTVAVGAPGVANGTVRRNWAVGATLRSTAGSENAEMGCGPKQAFDGLPGSTWSTSQPGGDKELVLQLPEAVDVTGFGVDPGAGCGDSEKSATAQFQIAVGPSPTGPWTTVVDQTLGATHRHKMNVFPATRANVTYVRMLPMSTQLANEDYIDLSEFAVYGTPSLADTRLLTTPGTHTRSRTATFTFSGGTSYVCRWDAEPATACTSPASRTFDADQTHTFTVTATNANGTDPTPATHAFTIDTVAPAVSIGSATASADVATFTFGATDAAPVTYACTLDGATAPCTSPARYAGLADGPHGFTVTATDAAGNAASATGAVTIDATPPETTIGWAPPPILTTRDFAFAFGANEPASFTCSLDGAPAQPCASPLALSGLTDGAHSFVVTAIDASGQPDPTPARSDFTVAVPGLPPSARPTPTASPMPPLALASVSGAKTVSRKSGRVKLSLRGTKGAKLTAEAKLGTRRVGKTTKTLRASTLSLTLTLDKRRLKVGKTVVVTVKATGSGMAAATRTLKIRVKA